MMNQHTSQRHRRPVTVESMRCFVCNQLARIHYVGAYRGQGFGVCLQCSIKYQNPVGQAEKYGRRYRFVEKSEIPHPDTLTINEGSTGFKPWHPYHEIYKICLLVKERMEILGKEVEWKVDDQTKKILKLPAQVAAIVARTYTVCGDDAKLDDNEALVRIRDLLESIDPAIIDRNKKKRLP